MDVALAPAPVPATPAASPDSNNVSPKTPGPPQQPVNDKQAEYFPHENNTIGGSNTSVKTSEGEGEGEIEGDGSSVGRKSSISFVAELPSRPKDQAQTDNAAQQMARRKSSTASVTFHPPRNLLRPQGYRKQTDTARIRDRSPAHPRYVLLPLPSLPFVLVARPFARLRIGRWCKCFGPDPPCSVAAWSRDSPHAESPTRTETASFSPRTGEMGKCHLLVPVRGLARRHHVPARQLVPSTIPLQRPVRCPEACSAGWSGTPIYVSPAHHVPDLRRMHRC